jgi:hypothetical protein
MPNASASPPWAAGTHFSLPGSARLARGGSTPDNGVGEELGSRELKLLRCAGRASRKFVTTIRPAHRFQQERESERSTTEWP